MFEVLYSLNYLIDMENAVIVDVEATPTRISSDAYSQSACDRKKIERLFGEAKHNLAMTRLRLRGLSGATDEFLLTATVQNLKRLAKLAAIPPPQPMIA